MIFSKEKNIFGFTMIELVLYVVILSTILLFFSNFLAQSLEARIRNQTVSEVDQQGVQVMQNILQETRNAEKVVNPEKGENGSLLHLLVRGEAVIFEIEEGTLFIVKEGERKNLISNRVKIKDIVFENLSREDTPGTLRVDFTIEYFTTSQRREYSFSRNFTGSASLR